MIKAENIEQRKQTDDGQLVLLHHMNFHIEKGEFVAFIAGAGEGKTSLIKTLGLLTPIKHGKLYIDDIEVSELSAYEKIAFRTKHIGVIFSEFLLIDELTVFENVELPLIYSNIDSAERKRRVEITLAQLNLSHRKKSYPSHLPTELQKQVELARALAIQPKVILVDEPAANISASGYESFMKKLVEINDMGITIVITSDQHQDSKFIHRSLFLENGEIVAK